MKARLIEIFTLLLGMMASVFAYLDTRKGWISLTILAGSMALSEIMERIREFSGSSTR